MILILNHFLTDFEFNLMFWGRKSLYSTFVINFHGILVTYVAVAFPTTFYEMS